jgi:hypothetical protein
MKDTVVFTKKEVSISNVYISCDIDDTQPQCNDGKLMINEKAFNVCCEYLSNDIDNSYSYELLVLRSMGVIDKLKFIRRDHEKLVIKEIMHGKK